MAKQESVVQRGSGMRSSLSFHEMIMQDDDDSEDQTWLKFRSTYKEIVDDYGILNKKRQEVSQLETKLSKNCESLRKNLSTYQQPAKEHFISGMKSYCDDIASRLPSFENGFLLWIVIGQLNVIFGNLELKLNYKWSYERFKLVCNALSVTLVFLTWFFYLPQIILYSLLVYYYFTLTIREHILVKNGSKIQYWWLLHHYITIVITLLLLTWPAGVCYETLHDVLMFSILMTSIIQLVQYFYQRRTIDKNIMLGKDKFLKTTNEGIRSKRMVDLVYIVPLLISLYIVQAYTSFRLFRAWQTGDCKEHQVPILSLLFSFLCVGNCVTLSRILSQKVKQAKSKPK